MVVWGTRQVKSPIDPHQVIHPIHFPGDIQGLGVPKFVPRGLSHDVDLWNATTGDGGEGFHGLISKGKLRIDEFFWDQTSIDGKVVSYVSFGRSILES